MWRSQEMRKELKELHSRYAWLIIWPVVLFLLLKSCGGEAGSAAPDSDRLDNVIRYSVNSVSAYVSASAASSSSAEAIYGKLVAPPSGQESFPFPDETILGISAGTPKLKSTASNKSEMWSVPVDVTTDDGTQTWLQYVMITTDGAISVQDLPGLLPPPKSGDKPTVSAAGKGLTRVDAGSRIYISTKDFLNAWLTGAGDISRLAESQVPTFVNPPCDSIEKLTVTATDRSYSAGVGARAPALLTSGFLTRYFAVSRGRSPGHPSPASQGCARECAGQDRTRDKPEAAFQHRRHSTEKRLRRSKCC